jgi:hypothetical protein
MSNISDKIRAIVRYRAGKRCEYCHKPDKYGAYPFHVDHIIARKHKGEDDLENLAWACFECNVNKGTDIASYNEMGILIPLFNPRTQQWNDHFVFEDAWLKAKTDIGQITIEILQINHEEQLELRKTLMESGLFDVDIEDA